MFTIDSYKPEDKERLRYICKETAWESYKKNTRKLETVPILYNDYFTEQEPENVFVVRNGEGLAVGYIICAADPVKFETLMKREYRKRVWKVRPTVILPYCIFMTFYRLTPRAYRVHMHIDLLPECQRQGLGTKLIDTLRAHLKENGVESLNLIGVSKDSDGYPFYVNYGFQPFKTYVPGILGMTITTNREEIRNDDV